MKILNIDAYAAPKRALTLGGVNYDVVDLSVEAFMANIKLAQEIEAKGQMTPLEQVEHAVKMIKNSVPTLPEQLIKRLSIEQMGMVLDFVRGDLDQKLTESGTVKKTETAEGQGAGEAAPAESKS